MSVDKSPLFTGFHSVFEAHERGETIILGDYSDFLCDHLVGSHQYEGPIEASLVQRDPEQYSGIPKFTYCPKCGKKL